MASRSIFQRIVRYARIMLLVSCSCCLAGSLAVAIYTEIFLHRALRATGEILRLDEPYSRQEYAPVFRFTAVDGKTYTITSSIATKPSEFAVRDGVQVLYWSGHPMSARICSSGQLWFLVHVLAPIGLTHGIIGGVILLAELRLDKRLSQGAE